MIVVLFHTMFGLRDVERDAAARLRRAGHEVVLPDLFAGEHVDGTRLDDGFELMERVGWATIVGRATAAVRDLPADVALGGLSMGCGVVAELWPQRPDAAAVFLLHAPAPVPAAVPPATPVQLHVAIGDPFAPAGEIETFLTSAAAAGARAEVHTYDGAGHLYTDASLPDHSPAAAARTWHHVETLLSAGRARPSRR